MQILGFYRASLTTGLLTGVAAGTSTAGHIMALRWRDASKLFLLKYIRLRWQTTTAFTAAQEMLFKAIRASGYTAAHTGGTQIAVSGQAFKARTAHPATAIAANDLSVGGVGALTAGTHTLDAEAFASLNAFSQLGASPFMPYGEKEDWLEAEGASPLILAQDEGIIVRNEVAMGAAGVGRLTVDLAWAEANP